MAFHFRRIELSLHITRVDLFNKDQRALWSLVAGFTSSLTFCWCQRGTILHRKLELTKLLQGRTAVEGVCIRD